MWYKFVVLYVNDFPDDGKAQAETCHSIVHKYKKVE